MAKKTALISGAASQADRPNRVAVRQRELGDSLGSALSPKARLVTLVNVPLGAAVSLLLWRSLDWPLIGDATIFHFIADQMRMGAIPYRDIYDINMPLIYFIHLAVVAIGGMSDVAWRAFDLASAAAMSGLILMVVWPAGRALASIRAAENSRHCRVELLLTGALAAIAASIKPTGVLLLALPAIGMARLRWHDAIWTMIGAAIVGLLVIGLLA